MLPILVLIVVVESQTHREARTLTAFEKGEVLSRQQFIREVDASGQIILSIRQVGQDIYSKDVYSPVGEPVEAIQEGPWGKLVTTFSETGFTQHVNDKTYEGRHSRKALINPRVLWFWKTQPKKKESVLVTYASANNPSVFQIRHTYVGQEKILAAGKMVLAHKVIEEPLSSKGKVFTYFWYDEKGMPIQRYHSTGTYEGWMTLESWTGK